MDISGSTKPLCLRHFAFAVINPDHYTEDWTLKLDDGRQLRAHFDLARAKRSDSVRNQRRSR